MTLKTTTRTPQTYLLVTSIIIKYLIYEKFIVNEKGNRTVLVIDTVT